MTTEEFKHLCDLTLELTKLKLAKVGHLAIENFAEETLHKLIHATRDKPAARTEREWYLVQASTFGTDMFATVRKPIPGDAHSGAVIHVREVLPE